MALSSPTSRHPTPWLGYALAAAGAILFSTKSILIKLAYAEGVSAEALLALRMALSLPFYVAIGLCTLLRRLDFSPLARPATLRAAWVGVLGYWFASYTDFLGLTYISAHFERLILFTYPGFVVLFGAMFFGHRVRVAALAAIGVSYGGLAVIFASHRGGAGTSNVAAGAGLVLLAAMAFAGYQLLAKDAIASLGPKLFTCVAMSAASAVALGQFAAAQLAAGRPLSAAVVSPAVLWYGLLLAVGATVLPSFMLNAALHRISAQANAVLGTLSPVVTIALAVLLLNEPFGAADVVGSALVIAGVGWFTLADRKAESRLAVSVETGSDGGEPVRNGEPGKAR